MPVDINYFLKIRPTQEETKEKHFFQIIPERKAIEIIDPNEIYKKGKSYTFCLDGIFNRRSPEEIYNEAFKAIPSGLFKGKESAIICYGQTGSGKTYSIFGERKKFLQRTADKKGLSHIVVEELFLHPDIACSELFISFIQITGDKVYDLGKTFAASKARMEKPFSPSATSRTPDLFTGFSDSVKKSKEDSSPNDNQIEFTSDVFKWHIGSLTQVQILNVKDYYDSIFYLFEAKKNSKQSPVEMFSHTIMILTINYKPPSNLETPTFPKKGMLYFVDLAGSEKIANEQQNFSFSSGVAFDLKNLQKILMSISQIDESVTYVPYKESKLSICLRNILKSGKQINILSHIIPVVAAYEDTLLTLQYIERCNGQTTKEVKTTVETTAKPEHERIIKKIEEENNDLRNQLDNEQTAFKNKLKAIQNSLGLQTDLDKMFTSTNVSMSSEMEVLRKHKRNCERIQSMEQLKVEIGKKLLKLNEKIDSFKIEESKLKASYDAKTRDMNGMQTELITENDKLKIELSQLKEKLEQEEATKIQQESLKLKNKIKEKSDFIHYAQDTIEEKEKLLKEAKDLKDIGKREIESEYKTTIIDSNYKTHDQKARLLGQFNFYSSRCDETKEKLLKECKQSANELKEVINSQKKELVALYDAIKKQYQLIKMCEDGGLTNGIKSLKIPIGLVQPLPTQATHK